MEQYLFKGRLESEEGRREASGGLRREEEGGRRERQGGGKVSNPFNFPNRFLDSILAFIAPSSTPERDICRHS